MREIIAQLTFVRIAVDVKAVNMTVMTIAEFLASIGIFM